MVVTAMGIEIVFWGVITVLNIRKLLIKDYN